MLGQVQKRARSQSYWFEVVVIDVRSAKIERRRVVLILLHQVEGCLYSIPKQVLASQSPVFEGMFDIGDASVGEGTSEDKPIVLEGYRSSEFECLLKVLLPKLVRLPYS